MKYVTVSHCDHCPFSVPKYRIFWGQVRYTCAKAGKPLHHIGKPVYNLSIPGWCPLPDYKKGV